MLMKVRHQGIDSVAHLATDEQVLVDLVNGAEGIGGGPVDRVREQQDRHIDDRRVQVAGDEGRL